MLTDVVRCDNCGVGMKEREVESIATGEASTYL